MPEGVQRDKLASSYSADGILTISAPRVITAPEGAKVEEAMAAASKAYTTDDGKTSVKQDSAESSQMIAASTQSPAGGLLDDVIGRRCRYLSVVVGFNTHRRSS